MTATARVTSRLRQLREYEEAQDTLRAIRSGQVDALVVTTAAGDEVFTLSGADRPYRLIVEGMAEGTLTLSEAGTILYANASLCTIVGVPSELLIGSPAKSLVSVASQAAWTEMMDREGLEGHTNRLVLETRKRGPVAVRASSSHFEIDGHRTTCVVVTDVSEEEGADHARRFQSMLLDATGEAIIASDLLGTVVYANPAAEALYGWDHGTMVGRSISETTVAGGGAPHADEVLGQFSEGRSWSGEIRATRKDGSQFWAHVTHTPVPSELGLVAGVIGVSSDISSRVEADHVLQAQAAISERIAADAPVGEVLREIAAMAVGDAEDTRVSFMFDHPDFQFITVPRRSRLRGQRIPILLGDVCVGSMTVSRGSRARLETGPDALRVAGARNKAALVAQREISKARLSRQALHDPLTGLANRTLLVDRIGRALASSSAPVTLLVAGVDHFKHINDGLGHDVGDHLLQSLAGRLGGAIDPEDTLARFGGDEFAVLINRPSTDLSVVRLAEHLLTIAQEAIVVGDNQLQVTVSIGIAVRTATTDNPTGLMADADAALDEAKRTGRNRMVMSGVDSRQRVEDRLALEQELRAGIPRGELVGYLQPVMSLATGAVDGAEILVRWQHPTRGLLMPVAFVPWAEQTDLVHAIGTAMLEEACAHLIRLGPSARLVVSVNAAAREITDPGYAKRTLSTLDRHHLPGSLLGIEVTESVAITNIEAVRANLLELRAAGVTIYLDDFGTGYSSLSYLRQLPVDVLKIDRSFISAMSSDPKAAEMVAAVAALARALTLSTVAEGVETTTEADALAALGVDRAQGYLYAKPQPVDAFVTWLRERERTGSERRVRALSILGPSRQTEVGADPTPPFDVTPPAWASQRRRVDDHANVVMTRPSGDAIEASSLRAGTLLPEAARPHRLLAFMKGTRALHQAVSVEAVVDICCSVVRELGGTVLPARLAGSGALPLELSFGQGEPLLPLPPTREVREAIEAVLPDLLEDARFTVARVRRTGTLTSEATIDGLTGLLNRRSIDRVLAHTREADAILLMDLDDFKDVNDQLGHPTGDLVLTAFARVLRQEGRSGDRFGRLGGDEFIAVLPGASVEQAAALLGRLRHAWATVRPHPVTFSAGIAPASADDMAGPLAAADRALYVDKASRQRHPSSPRIVKASA